MSTFLKAHGFENRNIVCLSDEGKQGIVDALERMVRNARRGHTLVFYYSGHGIQMESHDFNYLPCQDFAGETVQSPRSGYIKDSELKSIFTKAKPGVKILIITDACHSGTIMNLEHEWKWNWSNNKEVSDKKPLIISISACQDDEKALGKAEEKEGVDRKGGLFTETLLRVFGDSRQNPIAKAYLEIKRHVKRITSEKYISVQTPVLTSNVKMDLNKFTLDDLFANPSFWKRLPAWSIWTIVAVVCLLCLLITIVILCSCGCCSRKQEEDLERGLHTPSPRAPTGTVALLPQRGTPRPGPMIVAGRRASFNNFRKFQEGKRRRSRSREVRLAR